MASSSERFDVIIAGGSFAGLVMARALSASLGPGIRLAVIDPAPLDDQDTAAKGPRASALAAGARNMLDALGIWSQLADVAQNVVDIEITDTSLEAAIRPTILRYDNAVGNGEPASYIVENTDLADACLSAVAADPNITLFGSCSAVAQQVSPHSITVSLSDGSCLSAALLIAADGRNSPMRQTAGIKTISWDHDQIGIVTIVDHEKPHHGRAVQHFLPAGPFAILPLKGNRSCITWSEQATRGRSIMALIDADFRAEAQKRFGHKLGEITLTGPRASWPLSTRLARSFIAPRLALIGDAAHGVHPIAGQGLNLAIRDIAALSQSLCDSARLGIDLGDMATLERYERWRRFDSAVSAAGYSGLNALFSNDWTLLRLARDAGLGIVDRLPGLKRFFVDEAAGLTGEIPRLLKGELA